MNKAFILAAAVCLAMSHALQANALASSPMSVEQQQKGNTIQGVVLDQSGEPLIGATVRVKDSKTGTVTDLDGRFTLTDVNGPVEIFYIGYKTKLLKNPSGNNLRVQLEEDASTLEDVVVVGYGEQKKASLTSAISQIKGDEVFKDRNVSSTAVALQGEIPGLTITRTSTRPGSEGVSMQIRGDISINGTSTPLIIIDGVTGSLDELNSMNGADIENISVLKDASAAIYGSRAAAGVVLVTTKHGKKGKPQITYNGSVSRTINGIKAPLTTTQEWLDMFYQAQYNDAAATIGETDPTVIHNNINWWIFNTFGGPTLDDSDIDPETGSSTVYKGEKLFNALRSGKAVTVNNSGRIERWDPNYELEDELYGHATSQSHHIGISGADDRFGYNLSLGYESARSQLKPAYDGQKKWSARLNADYQALDFLKFSTNISYEKRDVQSPSTDVGTGWYDPWFWPIYNENGDAYDTFGMRNPLEGLTEGGTYKWQETIFRGNLTATVDFDKWVKGLSLVANGAYKMVTNDSQTSKYPLSYRDWVGNVYGTKQTPGSFVETINRYQNINLSAMLNYRRTFAQHHNVAAMIGITSEDEYDKGLTAGRYKGSMYGNVGLEDLNTFISGDNNAANGGKSSWGLLSYITRLEYDYDGKYAINFLGRRDGSSKLSEEQRWKNFYSISGYWRVTGEKFMQNIKWLNNLKIRYNYGKTGSVEGIGNYERYARMSTGTTILGVTPSAHTTMWLSGMTSDERTWETIKSHNIGVDFAFINNRLVGSFDYFVRTNDGMFISVEYPQVLGATAPKVNDGKFRSRGWEFALNWRDRIGEVRYNVGFNLADARAEVLALTNNENVPNAGVNSDRLIGMPRKSIYVYKTDGLFQTQEEVDAYYDAYYWTDATHTAVKEGNILPAPGEKKTNTLRPGARKVVDLNGDGVITRDDVYYAGDESPRLSFGIKAGLEWKGIDFSVFFQGIGKQKILRTGYMYAPFISNYTRQNCKFVTGTWTPENTDAEYAIMSRDANFNRWNYENKDVSVQNNRYIRLKSLVLGYTLPFAWTKKAGINKLRIYFSGNDLWEWTKVKDGYDPEYGEASNSTFPFSRQITFGVDVTF